MVTVMELGRETSGTMTSRYSDKPLEERQEAARTIREKYPDRVPVLVEKRRTKRKNDDLPDLDKAKYLVPSDLPWQQFQVIIRRRLKLKPSQAVFLFVTKQDAKGKVTAKLPVPTSTLGQIDAEDRDESGFISCIYTTENTFGYEL